MNNLPIPANISYTQLVGFVVSMLILFSDKLGYPIPATAKAELVSTIVTIMGMVTWALHNWNFQQVNKKLNSK